MIEILSHSPLLTLFIVVALGAIIGSIPFGRIKFGAAGALFVGLALSAVDPSLGEKMAIVQSLGLSLFVHPLGFAAGAALPPIHI